MENASSANPITRPESGLRSTQAAINCLRFVIGIQCFGFAGRYLLSSLESESHIFEYLRFDCGVSESIAQTFDDAGAYLCLATSGWFAARLLLGGILKLFKRHRQRGWSVFNWIDIFAAAFVAIWSVADAFSQWSRGGIYSELAIGEVAVRFACPIALILLLLGSRSRRSSSYTTAARVALALGIAITFLIHGFKATQLYGPFVDLILLTDMRLFQFNPEQPAVETALWIIGCVDILLAVAILLTRFKPIAIYVLAWGLITSLSRMTALGFAAWPETTVRAANWGAALVLLMLWWQSATQRDGDETAS